MIELPSGAVSLWHVSLSHRSPVETVVALDNVNVDVESGTFVAVFGASGSGKTTLLNVISGLQVSDSGTVVVGGHEVQGLGESDRARLRLEDVGVVFQDHNLIPEFTSLENVMLPLRARGIGAAKARIQAGEWLSAVGLEGVGRRKPGELSGGQRQRVGIARALVGGRTILLADEPTGALDTDNSRAVFDLLRRFADRGVTVMVATHDPLVRESADRLIRLIDGRVVSVEASEATS